GREDEGGGGVREGGDGFGPTFAIERDRNRVCVTWVGLQHYEVLRAQHVAQEFAGEHRELQAVLFLGHFLIAAARFDEAQVADIAAQRYLRGRDAEILQLLGELFLRGDPLAADEFQNLALTVALGHAIISFSRFLAAAMAAATALGPVPPGTSRDCIPRFGSSSSGKGMPNSRICSAVQSEGFLPPRTLSSTNFPTIWCA